MSQLTISLEIYPFIGVTGALDSFSSIFLLQISFIAFHQPLRVQILFPVYDATSANALKHLSFSLI